MPFATSAALRAPMVDLTPEIYEAAIPKCCTYRTLEEHMNGLMLCWGLTLAIEEDRPMDCTGCPLKQPEGKPGGSKT